MGYTHYWELNERSFKGSLFSRAVEDMNKIVEVSPDVADWDGSGSPNIRPDFVEFNGIGDDSHETFCFQAFEREDEHFNFCKTARKPYDFVVTACLAVAAEVIGDGIEVSSDGEPEDWEDGAKLASEVLGREIKVPIPKRMQVESSGPLHEPEEEDDESW